MPYSVMPRAKGLNMPRKRKRPVIEEVEEPEDMLELDDEDPALGLSPSSSSASPTAPTRRGPSTVQLQKLQDAYEEKLLESEVAKEYAKKQENELALAKRRTSDGRTTDQMGLPAESLRTAHKVAPRPPSPPSRITA